MMLPERIAPGPGQESVWDYPRPPVLLKATHRIRVEVDSRTIADTTAAYRVLETSHPPVYYLPRQDIDEATLTDARAGVSLCEFKGIAHYLDVAGRPAAAWFYPDPFHRYAAIAHLVAFYPSRVDACWVDDEAVQPQEGDYYGGWVTSAIVGPFKGGPGTEGW